MLAMSGASEWMYLYIFQPTDSDVLFARLTSVLDQQLTNTAYLTGLDTIQSPTHVNIIRQTNKQGFVLEQRKGQ
jgi:hypothetical protein